MGIAMSLVWHFQKGISCRGKFAVFGLVWFGGHPNQLQRSPLQCPWSCVFKKVYHVGVNMLCLVWFGLVVTQISCRGHHCSPCPCLCPGVFKKVYHVGVNMHYLVWFGLEVTQISCRGHHCIVLGGLVGWLVGWSIIWLVGGLVG